MLKKILNLTLPELFILCEASFFLTVAFILKRFLPLHFYAPLLGKHMASTPEVQEKLLDERIRPIQRTLIKAAKNLPLQSKCLDLAIASTFMLRRRKIKSTLYLGVLKDATGLCAHAWVRSGKTIVTGADSMEEYTVISSFA